MSGKKRKDLIEKLRKLGILKPDEPMSKHTSFRTGGPADLLIIPYSAETLMEAVGIAAENSLPVTVVGGCSNILVGDKGIRGLVIKLCEGEGINGRINIKEGLIYADSITKKDVFIDFCLNRGFQGMEFMAGIPGCIGGGIIMNAGIESASFADIMESAVCMDMTGMVGTRKIDREMAGYRSLNIGKDVVVLGGYFILERSGDAAAVKKRIDCYKEERRLKHPLDWPSAGSVFKNPEGHSSWKLIDDAGLKGKREGGAAVSDLHTNFIINVGNARSADILNLIEIIRETVLHRSGILLETEIRMVGEF